MNSEIFIKIKMPGYRPYISAYESYQHTYFIFLTLNKSLYIVPNRIWSKYAIII